VPREKRQLTACAGITIPLEVTKSPSTATVCRAQAGAVRSGERLNRNRWCGALLERSVSWVKRPEGGSVSEHEPGGDFGHRVAEGAQEVGRKLLEEAPHLIREGPHIIEAIQATQVVQAASASIAPIQQLATHATRHGRKVAVSLACCSALGGGGYAVYNGNHQGEVPRAPTPVISPWTWNFPTPGYTFDTP
jgi:hypothetical protein